jgi:uncharacterized protein (TIGR00369 family)
MKSRGDSGDGIGTPFQRSLGLIWHPGPASGELAVTMALRPELCGPAGSLEGGVVSTLADVAGASACAMALGHGLVATEHITVSFLAPGRVGPVVAAAQVLRAGRRDAVAEVRVTDTGQDDRLLAVAHVTVRALEARTPAGDGAVSAVHAHDREVRP